MSYDDFPMWERYQRYFPEELRCGAAAMPTEERWSWHGLDVHIDRMRTPDAPLKVVVLHGAGAYGRIMAPVAVLARRQGFDTVAPDLPGYGLTKAPTAKLDYQLWVDLVVDLIDAEMARDGKPVALFGVSLGGLLAYHAAAQSRKVVGVIATTLADLRTQEARDGFARNKLLSRAGLPMIETFRLLLDRLPIPMRLASRMNRISNNPSLAALCTSDPLGGGNWMPARFLRTMLSMPPAIEPEDFDICPVLLAHPGEDRMTDIALSRAFFERLACEKQMVVLEGASHMPIEHPGIDQLQSAALAFLEPLRRPPSAQEAPQ